MGADESDGGQTTAAIAAEVTSNHSELLGHEMKYQALIHAGDLAYNLDSDEGRVGDRCVPIYHRHLVQCSTTPLHQDACMCTRFMEQIEPVASSLSYMVSPGNHEVRSYCTLSGVLAMVSKCISVSVRPCE